MRTVILCGGRGTRAWPATAEVPKPMLAVGGRPVLQDVMTIYAAQGVTDFVLATGYCGDVIAEWVARVDLGWHVECVDTGIDTDTGDRLRACAAGIDGTFFATYGDGLGNVDLAALLRRHREHGGAGTVTAVPLPSPYGTIGTDENDRVVAFREKPVLRDHWINAGFFAFDAAAVTATGGPSLERDLLPNLAAEGALGVYRHDGFWKSMDSHKDVVELDRLAREEDRPWLRLAPGSTVSASLSPEPPASSART